MSSSFYIDYEFGIRHVASGKLHREGMTFKQARDWIKEFEEELGGKIGAFVVVRKGYGPWEEALV
jgi:hypothetical protein